MDQTIINWLLGGFGALIGFLLNAVWQAVKDLQAGFGWKLNGRLAVLFRFQSDATSAAGVTGPNTGQATGFNYGTH